MKYWLIKSEPTEYRINDLERDQTTSWTGVRNYQARNLIKEQMNTGDSILFYHSSAGLETGVAGTGTIDSEPYPDQTQFDTTSDYFDSKSTKENPRWWSVTIRFKQKLPAIIPLSLIKQDGGLEHIKLVQQGNRLSVMPLTKTDFFSILSLAKQI